MSSSFYIQKSPKFLLIVGCIALLTSKGTAQSYKLHRQVVGSFGTTEKAEDIDVSVTGGESVIGTIDSFSSFVFTQGFQQPDSSFQMVNANDKLEIPTFNFILFPNPVREKLTVQLNSPSSHIQFSIQIINEGGRSVLQTEKKAMSGSIQIDCKRLPAGKYWVLLKSPSVEYYQALPFIKIN